MACTGSARARTDADTTTRPTSRAPTAAFPPLMESATTAHPPASAALQGSSASWELTAQTAGTLVSPRSRRPRSLTSSPSYRRPRRRRRRRRSRRSKCCASEASAFSQRARQRSHRSPCRALSPALLAPRTCPFSFATATAAALGEVYVHHNPRPQIPTVFRYTSGIQDIDVSAGMAANRVVEPLYNLYWRRLTESCCAKGGLVLDVGANFGYYSLFAAKLGCRVLAFEPVPAFRAFLELGLALNNLSHRVHVRHAVASDVAGQNLTLQVPQKGIWGTASIGGLNVDPAFRSTTYPVSVLSETLDQFVAEQPCGMKLDVEGFEPSVLLGAEQMLRKFPPIMILTEYTPGVAERRSPLSDLKKYPASLQRLAGAGYSIWHLVGARKGRFDVRSDWATVPLPSLRRVTQASISAELKNADNMIKDMGTDTFAVPWDLHPRSLHAEFSHNTDLLLSLDSNSVAGDRQVGVWPDSPYGLGGGLCFHVRRDGTAAELIGRLCVHEGRNMSIAAAIATADAPRPLARNRLRHNVVRAEADGWELTGQVRSSGRLMRRRIPASWGRMDGQGGRGRDSWIGRREGREALG